MSSIDDSGSAPVTLTAPQYRLIAAELRHQILAGDLVVGDAIPAEHEIARRHGVSRMTARHAVTQLVDQGLLRREQGRGTFVTERKVVRGLSSVTGLREDLEREGLAPGAKVLSLERRRATREEAGRLELPRAREVWHMVRSRTADGVTIALQIVIIPVDLVPDLDTFDLQQGSLYGQLRDRELPLVRARQRIEAVNAPDVAAQLGVGEETAFLRVRRLSRAPDRRPVELLVSYFVGDVYAYDVELD
jgi:GntR family transcriptional regulator